MQSDGVAPLLSRLATYLEATSTIVYVHHEIDRALSAHRTLTITDGRLVNNGFRSENIEATFIEGAK